MLIIPFKNILAAKFENEQINALVMGLNILNVKILI
jgi:hypothetical protein